MESTITPLALARRSFETIESWYYQGVITQVQWEAWQCARDILKPARYGDEITGYPDDATEMARQIVKQWENDHEGVYRCCNRCTAAPGQLVEHLDGTGIEALCYTCWLPLSARNAHTVKVLKWINKYGKLQK